MHIFDGTILKNFRIKFINQNQKTVEQAIPPIYNLQRDQHANEACKVYIENGQIVKIELANGQEPPRRQVQSSVSAPTRSKVISSASTSTSSHSEGLDKSNFKKYLPADTSRLLPGSVENYSLRLNKYAESDEKNKFNIYKVNRGIVEYEIKPNFTKVDFKSISTRHHSNAKSLLGEANIKDMNLKTDWRMALGLGNESVYETSITLHHIYGIPYIPASAIKGVVRSWIITHCFADDNDKEHPLRYSEGYAIQNKLFCDLFGCPEKIKLGKKEDKSEKEFESYYQKNEQKIGGDRQGKVIFFDVFPTSNPQVKVDIMNPHYGEYYSSEGNNIKPPGDYYNPIPIPFLTVENTSFQFIIGMKKITKLNELKDFNPKMLKDLTHYSMQNKTPIEELNEITSESSLLNLVIIWLKLVLTEHGIGAKTAVGYGYMTPQK